MYVMFASHLISNREHYIVASGSPCNADTEAPNEEVEFIASVEDPQIRKQLKTNLSEVCKIKPGEIALLFKLYVIYSAQQHTNKITMTPCNGMPI